MADTTTVMAMPFPEGSDANDVPADIQALAERIDAVPGIESVSTPSRCPAPTTLSWDFTYEAT